MAEVGEGVGWSARHLRLPSEALSEEHLSGNFVYVAAS
jgi:hypothetical protein